MTISKVKQALTVAYNDRLIEFYGHHALQTPGPSQLAADGAAPSEEAAGRAGNTVKYHQYLLICDTPRASFQNFQSAYKHTRNAQDIGYKWATDRKGALWAYANRYVTQTSPNVPTSAQQPSNDSLVSISSGTPDGHNRDAQDDGVDPTDQLLRESWTNSTANNQAFSMQK
jgi:hypothetical protein